MLLEELVVRCVVMWCWKRGRCVRCSSVDGDAMTERKEEEEEEEEEKRRDRGRLRRHHLVRIASNLLEVWSDRRASR